MINERLTKLNLLLFFFEGIENLCSVNILRLIMPHLGRVIRDVTRTLIGGCLFIYTCSARWISFEFELISKEIRRA